MAHINELRGDPITKEQADEFVKNYKQGDPIPQEYVDYAVNWLIEHNAQLDEFNEKIRIALNLK